MIDFILLLMKLRTFSGELLNEISLYIFITLGAGWDLLAL